MGQETPARRKVSTVEGMESAIGIKSQLQRDKLLFACLLHAWYDCLPISHRVIFRLHTRKRNHLYFLVCHDQETLFCPEASFDVFAIHLPEEHGSIGVRDAVWHPVCDSLLRPEKMVLPASCRKQHFFLISDFSQLLRLDNMLSLSLCRGSG